MLAVAQSRHENGPSWHRDVTWWGTERATWLSGRSGETASRTTREEVEPNPPGMEIRGQPARLVEREGVSMFLALDRRPSSTSSMPGSHEVADDPLPGTRRPAAAGAMKDKGVPYDLQLERHRPPAGPGGDSAQARRSPGPQRGHPPHRATPLTASATCRSAGRNRLGPVHRGRRRWPGRGAWQLDPAVREALPRLDEDRWDRWAETQRLGDTLEDRYAGFDINGRIKSGEVEKLAQRAERQASAAGEAWKRFSNRGCRIRSSGKDREVAGGNRCPR